MVGIRVDGVDGTVGRTALVAHGQIHPLVGGQFNTRVKRMIFLTHTGADPAVHRVEGKEVVLRTQAQQRTVSLATYPGIDSDVSIVE